MKTLGRFAVVIVGWVVLVVLLNALLPGTAEMTRTLRGGIYLAYIVVAVIFLRGSHSRTTGGE